MPKALYKTPARVYAVEDRNGVQVQRRLRTTETTATLSVKRVLEAFPPEQRQLITALKLYYNPNTHAWQLSEPGVPIMLEARQQWRGKRFYFICPISGLLASKLYVVQIKSGPVIGSAKGLGLSYPSQSLHKTPKLDAAITSWGTNTSPRAAVRAMQRQSDRLIRGARRFL